MPALFGDNDSGFIFSIFSFKILSFNCNYTNSTTEVIEKGQV